MKYKYIYFLDQKRNLETSLKIFFSKGELITETYVDDPRNTDNAWMETVAYNYHDDNGTIVNNIPFEGGDDAVGVRWIDVDKSLHLYASHKDFLEELVNIKNCHW